MSKLVAVVVVGIFAVTACSSGDGAQQPPKTSPSSSTATAPNTPSTTKPTTTDPLAGYTPLQVQAYQEALGAYKHYREVVNRAFAGTSVSPDVLARLRSVELDTYGDWRALKLLSSAQFTIVGTGWVSPFTNERPTRIVLGKDGSGSVSITMCVDSSGIREHYPPGTVGFPHGRTFVPPGKHGKVSQTVVMDHYPDGPWKFSNRTTGKEVSAC